MNTATHSRSNVVQLKLKLNGKAQKKAAAAAAAAADDPARPYRLWNANEKKAERWRCYLSVDNAHNGATLQLRWAPLGTHIEVYDVRTWRHLGTYTKRLKPNCDGVTVIIEFTKGDGHVIVRAGER